MVPLSTGVVLDGQSLWPLLIEKPLPQTLISRPLFWHFPNYMRGDYMGIYVNPISLSLFSKSLTICGLSFPRLFYRERGQCHRLPVCE
jgi:hypothetical protein